jgi:ribA/ribD-fused uncharacterized protein
MIFHKEYDFLSNFYICKDGTTVEHRYQAAKSTYPYEYDMIIKAETAGRAKRLGQQIVIRKDWKSIKYDVMKSLVFYKFLSDPELGEKLCKIKEDIIEHNTWHDNEWGDCTCEACTEIEGRNWLGEILMEVRTIIKNAKASEMEDAFDVDEL